MSTVGIIGSLPTRDIIYDFGGTRGVSWLCEGLYLRHHLTNKVYYVIGSVDAIEEGNIAANVDPSDDSIIPAYTQDGRVKCEANLNSIPFVDTNDRLIYSQLGGSQNNVPMWLVGTPYAVQDFVSYNGFIWRCAMAHTSQIDWKPGMPGVYLWDKVSANNNGGNGNGNGTVQTVYVERIVKETNTTAVVCGAVVGALFGATLVAVSDKDNDI